ncbi:porin family protein [Limibacter armeniacum]|uniref:porin family protein n=1 Tax=Limibacter armeniacum TaxID=466084 RepID=UPI002FE67AA6
MNKTSFSLSIFLLALILTLPATLLAQVELKPHIGINAFRYNDDPGTFESDARAGIQLGASLAIGNKVYFEPGFQFVNRKTELVSTQTDRELSIREVIAQPDLKGIRVPLLVGLRFADADAPVNFRVFAGPSATFLTNKEENVFHDFTFKETDWGMNVGAGLDLFIFFIDAGYEFGINKTFADTRSRSLYANAGVKIKF